MLGLMPLVVYAVMHGAIVGSGKEQQANMDQQGSIPCAITSDKSVVLQVPCDMHTSQHPVS